MLDSCLTEGEHLKGFLGLVEHLADKLRPEIEKIQAALDDEYIDKDLVRAIMSETPVLDQVFEHYARLANFGTLPKNTEQIEGYRLLPRPVAEAFEGQLELFWRTLEDALRHLPRVLMEDVLPKYFAAMNLEKTVLQWCPSCVDHCAKAQAEAETDAAANIEKGFLTWTKRFVEVIAIPVEEEEDRRNIINQEAFEELGPEAQNVLALSEACIAELTIKNLCAPRMVAWIKEHVRFGAKKVATPDGSELQSQPSSKKRKAPDDVTERENLGDLIQEKREEVVASGERLPKREEWDPWKHATFATYQAACRAQEEAAEFYKLLARAICNVPAKWRTRIEELIRAGEDDERTEKEWKALIKSFAPQGFKDIKVFIRKVLETVNGFVETAIDAWHVAYQPATISVGCGTAYATGMLEPFLPHLDFIIKFSDALQSLEEKLCKFIDEEYGLNVYEPSDVPEDWPEEKKIFVTRAVMYIATLNASFEYKVPHSLDNLAEMIKTSIEQLEGQNEFHRGMKQGCSVSAFLHKNAHFLEARVSPIFDMSDSDGAEEEDEADEDPDEEEHNPKRPALE